MFLGLPEAPITGLTLGGIGASFDPDCRSRPMPLMACHVPPMRHAGLCAEFAEVTLAGAVAPPSSPRFEEFPDAPPISTPISTPTPPAYAPYKGGDFCYEDGCLYRGLIVPGRGHRRSPLDRAISSAWSRAQVAPDGTLAGYDLDEFNIDNVLSGRALIYLARGHRRAALAGRRRPAGRSARPPPAHPLGRLLAQARYPWQVWLDGLYMGLPFQIEFAPLTDRPDLVGRRARAARAPRWP